MRQKNEPPKAAIRAVGLRRLLMLADQLDKTPMEPTKTTCGFDYNQWVGDDWENGNNSLCGTTGCALGIGATMPALRRAGLCFKRNVGDHGIVGLKHNVAANSIDAAMFVFALEYLEALYLFYPNTSHYTNHYPLCRSPAPKASAHDVAEHIRRFVAYAKKNAKNGASQ